MGDTRAGSGSDGIPKLPGLGRREFLQVAGSGVAAACFMSSYDAIGSERGHVKGGKGMQANLNGLDITLDTVTGSVLALDHPGPGRFLECAADLAGLVDLAYPISAFYPLRLASRFSTKVHIEQQDDALVVEWKRLGASRDTFDLTGKVSARVIIKAMPDGESVSMSCQISNDSDQAIPQVVFPDLNGLLPVAGPEQTIFKTGGFGSAPFVELRLDEPRRSTQFCHDIASGAAHYESGGMFHSMWLRWLDLGGLQGGFSLFPERWGWEPKAAVRLHHWEQEDKLRLLCVHTTDIQPGQTWDSGTYVLTPHAGGWARGIVAYREWVRAHTAYRPRPVPQHVREGLGYRTIWMSQGFPEDPHDIVWSIKDLESIAVESHAHGLDEMVLWGMMRSFELPLPDPLPHLGTLEDLANAIRVCREQGVNVAPFISVLQAGEATASKYGLTVPEVGGWPQHTDTIPRFQAPYLPLYRCAQVDTANTLWQQEVFDSCKRYIESGIASISWDQYWSTPEGHMNVLAESIREMACLRDPEATFSAEELWNLEVDWRELDYTWNWGSYRDCQAFTSVFDSPRISCNVDSDPVTAYRGFMDNLYLNIFPRKPGSVNGSDWIASHPELAAVLVRCAGLRKQFLPYFLEGLFIGNCILAQPCPETHVSAYLLPDKLLLMVLNLGQQRALTLACNPALWLTPGNGGYQLTMYGEDGGVGENPVMMGAECQIQTPPLQHRRLWVCEIQAAH